MGPVRGSKRRRRRADRSGNAEPASGQEAADWWDEFSRRIKGPSFPRGVNKFECVFKISRKTFDYICSLVREDLMAKPSNLSFSNGKLLSVDDQVAVALRRLSSGESLLNIGLSFGMHHSTVSQVTWRFVEAMEERGIRHLKWPSSEEEIGKIKSKFENIRGLPNCCGAIDTTHIKMCLPSVDPSSKIWVDHQTNYSMVLQVIVDPEMRIRDVVTGWPGNMNDFQVLQTSGFFKLCENGMRLNGKMEISEGSEVREYVVGDTGFPLLPWLLTPYRGQDLLDSKHEFNKRHFATRMVAQRTLARLKDMWQIVQGEMWRPDKHKLPRIALVCCLLHNIVMDLEDEVRDEMPLSWKHDPGYKQQSCEVVDNNGFAQREILCQYLSGRMPP